MSDKFTLNLKELICFLDERPKGSEKCSGPLAAVFNEELTLAMLGHYMEGHGKKIEILDCKCTGVPPAVKEGEKKKKGKWLDAWVKVTEKGKTIFYQTEIKSRSAHSLNGRKLSVDASEKEICKHRKDRFEDVFGEHDKHSIGVWKVLNEMKAPAGYAGEEIRPLLCIWNALHEDGKDESFFDIKIGDRCDKSFNTGGIEKQGFERLWVFSVSNYSRYLRRKNNCNAIKIELPNKVGQRLKWINRILKQDS